jgi:hypothetical protein
MCDPDVGSRVPGRGRTQVSGQKSGAFRAALRYWLYRVQSDAEDTERSAVFHYSKEKHWLFHCL